MVLVLEVPLKIPENMCVVVRKGALQHFFGGKWMSCGVMWQTYNTVNLTKAEIAAGIVPTSWLAPRYLFLFTIPKML